MKKPKIVKKFAKFIAVIMVCIICVSLVSCAQQEPARLLNAQGLDGVEIAVTQAVSTISTAPIGENTTAAETTASAIATVAETTEVTTIATPETTAIATTAPETAAIATKTTAPATAQITTTAPETTAVTTTTPATTAPAVTSSVPATTITAPPAPLAANHGEVRGVWISYIELQNAFAGKTEESFRKAFAEKMDNCASRGINTVYVHLRAFGDAYYKSALFPYAKAITGTIGQPPAFDPLEIMLEEAHSRGISFHGWLNPMRLPNDADMSKIGAEYTIGKWYQGSQKGTYIVKSGDNWYLNPAYPEVRALIADGAAEILRNYNIDGIHIDDYFYPPNITNAFDSVAFAASGFDSLSEFRLDNCTKMVKQLYDTVKSVSPRVLFGISPQGSIDNCYSLYADVRKWASQPGYCDYISPQIYYGFDNVLQPFDKCLKEWENLVKQSGVKLVPGLAVYKIGLEDTWAGSSGKNEWINQDDILKRQIELSKQSSNYGGVILFSYNYLFSPGFNTPAINAQLTKAGLA